MADAETIAEDVIDYMRRKTGTDVVPAETAKEVYEIVADMASTEAEALSQTMGGDSET